MTRRNKQKKDVQDVNAFMHEVEEAMHMEQLHAFWHQHKISLIATVVIAFGGFSGYKVYANQQEASLLDEANAYYENVKINVMAPDVSELVNADSQGVALLAKLRSIKTQTVTGKQAEALLELDKIITDENMPAAYRQLAEIYKAEISFSSDLTQSQEILEKLAENGSIYLPTVVELLGQVYEKQNNVERARAMYKQIIEMGGKAPAGVASRAQQRLNVLQAS